MILAQYTTPTGVEIRDRSDASCVAALRVDRPRDDRLESKVDFDRCCVLCARESIDVNEKYLIELLW